jgi:hypothetical protein
MTPPKAPTRRKRMAAATPSPPKKIGTGHSPQFHQSFDKEANVDNETPKSSTIREVETVSLPNIGSLLDSAVEEEEMNLSSLGTTDHPALLPPTPLKITPPTLKDQEEEPEEPPPEVTVVEPALPPSTLSTPQATLDDKVPATFGTLHDHPPTLQRIWRTRKKNH